jgi:DNA-binding CsgD family transcriptional regulator
MTRVHFGIVTLAKDGRVVNANPIAEQLLRDGDSLTQIEGRLTAVSRSANDRLQRAIANTARYVFDRKDIKVEPLVVPRLSGSKLRLLIAPLAASSPALRAVDPILIVFLFAKDVGATICPATLSLVYGLTSAEARVTAKLAEGYSLSEIAHMWSLSIETVRTQVKRAFEKTNCNSQTALAREILLGPTQSLSSRKL